MSLINLTESRPGQLWPAKLLPALLACAVTLCLTGSHEAAAQDTGGTFVFTGTAKDCLLKDGAAKDVCIAMIHSVRDAMKGGRSYGDYRACSPNEISDMQDTHAVIEWIRQHPERQDKDVNAVAREALADLYPCS